MKLYQSVFEGNQRDMPWKLEEVVGLDLGPGSFLSELPGTFLGFSWRKWVTFGKE